MKVVNILKSICSVESSRDISSLASSIVMVGFTNFRRPIFFFLILHESTDSNTGNPIV